MSCSIVETFGKDLNPRDLEATLRLEYRSKVGKQEGISAPPFYYISSVPNFPYNLNVLENCSSLHQFHFSSFFFTFLTFPSIYLSF